MANIKIIDLPTGSPESTSFVEATQVDLLSESGRSTVKLALNALGNFVAGQGAAPLEYGDLETESTTLIGGINELHDSIGADAYDDTASYTVGQYCIYNNTLYRCKANTTGAFDPSKWKATTIANEIPFLGNEVVLSASEPFITYRKYGHILFLYINTQGMTITSDTILGNLPVDCTPLMGSREYRGSGFVACDSENNNRIWARNVDSWTTCTMALPI